MSEMTTATASSTGRIARVLGAVVDVEFPRGAVPELFNALNVQVDTAGINRLLTLEANQARQAQITQEISEIVGGVDALASAGSES